jgi:PAS domain S-box-containing protein
MAHLVGYFFLLSLVIVISLGLFSYKLYKEGLKNALFEQLTAVATVKEDILNRWIEEQKEEILFFSRLPDVRSKTVILLTEEEVEEEFKSAYLSLTDLFQNILARHADLMEMFILTYKGGRVILSTDGDNEGQYRVTDTFYIRGKEDTYVQNLYPSPITLKPVMTISTPLYDEKQNIIGVFAAHLNMERMDKIIQKRLGLGATGVAYIVSRYNELVSSKRFGEDEFPRGIHSVGIDRAVKGISGYGLYENYLGIPVVGVYRWIQNRELALLVELHQDEAFKTVRRSIIIIIVVGLLLVMALAAGVYLIASEIARPILSIKDTALKVASGDLNSRVPVVTHDEIGVLAETFNQMTKKQKGLYDQLQRNEEYLHSLIDNVSDIIAIVDENGIVQYVNPAVENILGYTQEELIGKNTFGLMHPEDLPAMRNLSEDNIDKMNHAISEIECRFKHKDGSWRVLVSTGKNLLHHPAVNGVVVNTRDITEKKKAEEALRESEEWYRKFFEDDLTGDYISTPDGRLLACNPAFARMLGFSSIEELKEQDLFSFYSNREVRDEFLQLLRERKKLEYFEEEIRRRDGKPVYIVENAIGIFNERNELIKIKGYVFDNTERRRLEERLRQVDKMEAVGRLAGGIAHDFNNLLTAIIGYCEILLLKKGGRNPDYSCVKEIKKAADRATTLTKQLLVFSRNQVLQPKVININTLVANIEKLLKRLIGEDIELTTILDQKVGNVKADPGQIEQVLMNLAVNARDAMPDGGTIIIETQKVVLDVNFCDHYPELSPGEYALLKVCDTGVGMDEETKVNIFDPFFTTKEVGKGTGLGLSTVFGIVKQSNGYIIVESEKRRGTAFKLYLPRTLEMNNGMEAEINTKKMHVGEETILVVEDEEMVKKMICSVLENAGYTVYEAKDAGDAMSIAGRLNGYQIDLVVTDIVMPEMNGRALAEKLLTLNPNMEVLYISGYTEDSILGHGVLNDDMAFLQKPFTPEVLTYKVRKLLDRVR